MTHPLTDEVIEAIEMSAGGPCERCNGDLNMRAAADWQFEQVLEWLKECPNYDLETYTGLASLIHDLKKAMRPQEDN